MRQQLSSYFSQGSYSYIELSSHFGQNAVSFQLATAFVLNAVIKNAQRIHQSQNEDEAKVENLIGMLYSDVAERNVGKSLTLETIAKAQGIVGAGHPLHCSGGDQTISGVSIKMLMSALASTSLVCLVDDANINATFSEFLLQVHGGLAQGSSRTGLAVPRGSILISTNLRESERIYGRCIRINYKKDRNFSFQDEKFLNENLQNLVTENKGFLVAWAVLFQRLWLDNIEEPMNKIRALLKMLVPEQDQDRWYKGASSVLYTYALFHKVAGVNADLETAIEHIASGGQLRTDKTLSFWERFVREIKSNLQKEEKPPLTWLNPGVSVCMDDAFVPAIAIKISETGQFTSVGNKEIKDHIARALKKEKNLGETVTFAMSEAASITDIRRRKDGLVRNAKAYKMPKKILGTDLCHLIEHACGLRDDPPPTSSNQENQTAVDNKKALEETITELASLFDTMNTDYEQEDERPRPNGGGEVPIDELSPNTKMAYDIRSPRGKRNYEQGILDGIKIANLRQETVDERDSIALHDNVNTHNNTPSSSAEETDNAKRPRRRLQFASGTIGVLNSQNKGTTSAADRDRTEACATDEQCLLCGKDSPPSRKGGQLINWVDCDSCKRWFHLLCLKMKKKDVPADHWKCSNCK